MPFAFNMPKLSPTMEEGTIVKWHVSQGDLVKEGQLVIEVATDKATVEHEALDGGWLRKVICSENEEVVVGQPIAIFSEKEDESIEELLKEIEASQKVEEEEDVSSESSTEEKPKSKKSSGKGLAQPEFLPEPPLESVGVSHFSQFPQDRVKASPLAKKLAEQQGLDLMSVKGSGSAGRIVEQDLSFAQPLAEVSFGPKALPTAAPGTYSQEAITPMRKMIATRLQEAKTFIPHFYVTQDIDAQPMNDIRLQLKQWGVKVTVNDFIVRACALALRKHPVINSGFNNVDQTIVHYETIDVSVAVSVDGGLITPILRYADHKNLGQISLEVKELCKRARSGKLDPHEYKGGSFTVSNLGMFGIEEFQAIVNPPQGAILAVAGTKDVPVVKDGVVVPGKKMRVSLSSDHRVIDGLAAAQFLVTLKEYLENPAGLCLN
jgi:pyruvate dehydrogenase E2 component (dihydrolipoamide acetyltransferase)